MSSSISMSSLSALEPLVFDAPGFPRGAAGAAMGGFGEGCASPDRAAGILAAGAAAPAPPIGFEPAPAADGPTFGAGFVANADEAPAAPGGAAPAGAPGRDAASLLGNAGGGRDSGPPAAAAFAARFAAAASASFCWMNAGDGRAIVFASSEGDIEGRSFAGGSDGAAGGGAAGGGAA
jgi:hypothetical protein